MDRSTHNPRRSCVHPKTHVLFTNGTSKTWMKRIALGFIYVPPPSISLCVFFGSKRFTFDTRWMRCIVEIENRHLEGRISTFPSQRRIASTNREQIRTILSKPRLSYVQRNARRTSFRVLCDTVFEKKKTRPLLLLIRCSFRVPTKKKKGFVVSSHVQTLT